MATDEVTQRLSLYAGEKPLLIDATLLEVLEYLIANRVHILDDVEAQREHVYLLTLIQDNAPRGGDPFSP